MDELQLQFTRPNRVNVENLLKNKYNRVYLKGLLALGRIKEFNDYFHSVKDSVHYQNYSMFVIDFLIPFIDGKRKRKELRFDKKQFDYEDGKQFIYEGELDENGKACGRGKLG